VVVPLLLNQHLSAWAMNSGPLSLLPGVKLRKQAVNLIDI
jgi:hypothetical protein